MTSQCTKYIDLHTHTIFSDGTWTPEDLVAAAERKNFSAIAITDHDSVEGIGRAMEAAAQGQLEIIPGVEMSVMEEGFDRDIHLLGYFVDYKSPELLSVLEEARLARKERAYKMLEKLKDCGIVLDESIIDDNACVGRLHFAKAICEKGFAKTVNLAFQEYIGRNGPAYVARKLINVKDAVELIKRVGGVPVLAHPYYIKDGDVLERLFTYGVMGIEVWHTRHSRSNIAKFLDMAKRLKLIATGGSDCHGSYKNSRLMIGTIRAPYSIVEELKKGRGGNTLS
jgi:predicted metal-dependent phosphoesterase TrpH